VFKSETDGLEGEAEIVIRQFSRGSRLASAATFARARSMRSRPAYPSYDVKRTRRHTARGKLALSRSADGQDAPQQGVNSPQREMGAGRERRVARVPAFVRSTDRSGVCAKANLARGANRRGRRPSR
jgi:hypothetical protein